MTLLSTLTRPRLQEILSRFPDLKVGVVGDMALDGYWYADMTRAFLSRETPLFPHPIVRESYAPGAGANVAANLKTLGVGRVVAYSVLGEDWRGKQLISELEQRGVVTDQLLITPQQSTHTYLKQILLGYDSQQEDARLDFENKEALTAELEDALIQRVAQSLAQLDALVVTDQVEINGKITPRVLEALNEMARQHPQVLFLVDSRRRIGLFQNMVLKPNLVEAAAAFLPGCDPRAVSLADLCQSPAAQRLMTDSRPAFVTLSARGVLVCAEGRSQLLPSAPVQPPLDPVGAGDTFLAALAACLPGGATPWEAGAVATLAAATTTEKLNQTGWPTPAEVLARYDLAPSPAEGTPIPGQHPV